MIKAFISYSWDSDVHKEWVRNLATALRTDGVDVKLDQWHLVPGEQIPEFMERAVRESDFVLIICTPRYKERSDNRQGGVGYEGDIMTSEVMNIRNTKKFIPVLRHPSFEESAPSWLLGKYYIDLSSSPYSETQYADLLTTLLGKRPEAPPVGDKDAKGDSPSSTKPINTPSVISQFTPIRIIGVIVDQVGTPRNDGTRGSALYKVPFQLSNQPPPEWAELFVHFWDRPPNFSSMHRPSIASVVGDTVILNGTTVEEVEKIHRDTLVLVCNEANKKYQEFTDKKRKAEELKQKQLADQKQNIEEVAKRIKFD